MAVSRTSSGSNSRGRGMRPTIRERSFKNKTPAARSWLQLREPSVPGAVICQTPAVADLDELKIPKAMRPVAEAIILITDEVCAQLLDAEYADLASQAVAKLARKRPSPLLSGRHATWAAAVV